MYQRKTYTRMPKREIRDGKIDVSREELADFQNKFGKNLTLRDLLNYDRTGNLPEAAGRTASGRTAADRDTSSGRAEIPGAGSSKAPASTGEGMSEMRRNIANIVSALPAARAVSMAGKAAQTALAGRAAAKADSVARREPELGLPPQGSVWRSNRPPKDEIPTLREVVEPKPRIQVEGTKGGVYRSPKDEAATKPQPEFRSRTADRMDEKERLKKGGTTKAYAKGGSVKGSGCEQRGLRKCKVY